MARQRSGKGGGKAGARKRAPAAGKKQTPPRGKQKPAGRGKPTRSKTARKPRVARPTTAPPPDDPTLVTRALSPGDWPLIARLFGPQGACGGCWCMWPRVEKGGKTWEAAKGKPNQDRFRRLIQAGEVQGVLALAGQEPVGWCSFGPRADFPRLDGIRALRQHPRAPGTWSVVCFYIPAPWRGRGVAEMLLAAATRLAIAQGATRVEGYPADPKGKAMPAAFAWTGVPRLFEKVGYRRLPLAKGSRPVFAVEPT